ncbi:MAG: hypothetical protein ACE5FJ_06460, partial [Gemmatimonadales bacterium]
MDLRWNMDPVEATSEGAAEYDARYGNFTTADVRAHLAALRSISGSLEECDTGALDEEIDRSALLGDIRVRVNRFKSEQPHVRNPAFWLGHALEGLYLLLVSPGRNPEQRRTAAHSRLRDLGRFFGDARETLTDCPRVFVETALEVADGA